MFPAMRNYMPVLILEKARVFDPSGIIRLTP